jgi:hypothetical protein
MPRDVRAAAQRLMTPQRPPRKLLRLRFLSHPMQPELPPSGFRLARKAGVLHHRKSKTGDGSCTSNAQKRSCRPCPRARPACTGDPFPVDGPRQRGDTARLVHRGLAGDSVSGRVGRGNAPEPHGVRPPSPLRPSSPPRRQAEMPPDLAEEEKGGWSTGRVAGYSKRPFAT